MPRYPRSPALCSTYVECHSLSHVCLVVHRATAMTHSTRFDLVLSACLTAKDRLVLLLSLARERGVHCSPAAKSCESCRQVDTDMFCELPD